MIPDVYIFIANSKNRPTLSTNLDYFKNKFNGRSMKKEWLPPDDIKILRKSKPLSDFLSWGGLSSLIISDNAKTKISPLIANYVEFLPLITLKNKEYYALNVIYTAECIDFKSSDVTYSIDNPETIIMLNNIKFYKEKLPEVPIFKSPHHKGYIYVRNSFINAVIENKLTGAKFVDPDSNFLAKISRGEELNVVPGLPD